jgi:pyruvate/2-oxoglutarate/acetoin dehydrogenase E1 component
MATTQVLDTKVQELTYAQAINAAIREEMRRDPKVILMGEDVAGGATPSSTSKAMRRGAACWA